MSFALFFVSSIPVCKADVSFTSQRSLGTLCFSSRRGPSGLVALPLFAPSSQLRSLPNSVSRMQAYSPSNPVGAQHKYNSVLHAFGVIIKADGLKGLARGVDAAMLRTAMGSSVQLPTYNLAKVYLEKWGVSDGIGKFFLSSTFSGLCVCAVMQPAGASSPLLPPRSSPFSQVLT